MRRGATTGDVLIFLASLSIAGALLFPAWSVRGFRSRVENVVADVDAVAAAARAVRDGADRWPAATPPGEAPPELSALGGPDGPFSRAEYTLGWTAWDVVDSVAVTTPTAPTSRDDPSDANAGPRMQPVVRSVGAVTVRASEEALLAELQQHYADATSFVVDSTWLLVLPERGTSPVPR